MIIPTGNQWENCPPNNLTSSFIRSIFSKKIKKKHFFFNFCNETYILHDCTVVEDKKVFG